MAIKRGCAIGFVAALERAAAFLSRHLGPELTVRFTRTRTAEHAVTLAEFVDTEGRRVGRSR